MVVRVSVGVRGERGEKEEYLNVYNGQARNYSSQTIPSVDDILAAVCNHGSWSNEAAAAGFLAVIGTAALAGKLLGVHDDLRLALRFL